MQKQITRVFPRFARAACFPALDADCMFLFKFLIGSNVARFEFAVIGQKSVIDVFYAFYFCALHRLHVCFLGFNF